MKTTLDDREVNSRCWYYLLDWNEQDGWKTIFEVEPDGDGKLHLLTYDKFWKLFKITTQREMETK